MLTLGLMMSKRYFHKWWAKHKEEPKAEVKCHTHDCNKEGIYKAPKKGMLSHPKKPETWYWFCLEHVRSYNSSWNYFSEMSQGEILEEWHRDITWQRPSWPMGSWYSNKAIHMEHGFSARDKRQRIFDDPFGLFEENDWESSRAGLSISLRTPEAEAVILLELAVPFDGAQLQAAYRKMVKKNHPDLHQGCLKAEEKIKQINQAYALLKSRMAA
jgi:hypothetical protein